MASELTSLTRTDKNLWNAIVSEALAYLKYNAYAHKALEEGYPEVAQVFQEVAGAETIRGLNHLRVSGDIGATEDNLRTVTIGESKEFTVMYPKMIREAIAEDRADAAESFSLALERERHHLTVFTQALEQLEKKLSPARPELAPVSQEEAPSTTRAAPAEAIPSAAPPPAPDLDTFVSAAIELDRERWRVASLGRLREVVFGAQDGILSTVALVTSVAVAVDQTSTVLVAGFAAALAGMPLPVHGDGSQQRSFLHVEDLVDALLKVMARPAAAGGEVLEVGSEERLSISAVARRLVGLAGTNAGVSRIPACPRREDRPRRAPELSVLRRRIDFTPRWSLDAILRDALAHA